MTAAEAIGDPELARALVTDGLGLAAERGDAPEQVLLLSILEMQLSPDRATTANRAGTGGAPDTGVARSLGPGARVRHRQRVI